MMFRIDQLKGTNGKNRVQQLFYELSYDNPQYAIFTTKDEDYSTPDGKHLYSLKKLYLSISVNDPTEYTFAQTVFGNWNHWQAIFKSPITKKMVAEWRDELVVKIKSKAITHIATEMNNAESKNSFQAAKLLLDKGWLEKEPASKAKKQLEESKDEEQNQQALRLMGEDAARLGLKFN